jgi:outer membrane protein OmpA-like peptidoglycan-associated protein
MSWEKLMTYKASPLVTFVHLALGLIILAMAVTPARADPADDARIKQLRLLCVQLSGDLDDSFAIVKFKRCMSQDPATAIRQNAGLPTNGPTNSGSGTRGKPVNLLPGGPVNLLPGGPVNLLPGGPVNLLPGGPVNLLPGGPVSLTSGKPVALVGPAQALLVQETPHEIRLRLAGDLLFDFDKSDLRPDAVATLREVAAKIKATNPHGTILIAGYTDSKGSVPFNMRLSQQRAGSVETWLVQNAGFPGATFSPVGYGAANPVAPNETADGHDDPDGRQRNRRVEIVIPK